MSDASFDDIPAFLKRSKFVKPENSPLVNTTKRFQSTKDKFETARQMFDDADDAIEVINASKVAGLPASPSWKHQSAVPCRQSTYKPLAQVVTREGVTAMLRKRLQMAGGSTKKRTTKSSPKRRRVVESGYGDDDIEDIENSDEYEDDEDDDVLCECESLEEEEVSEDEEMTSGDERFIANDDSEDEEDSSASEYSEGEAEFSDDEESDESSSEDEVECESDDEESEVGTHTQIVEQTREVINAVVSGSRRQIARKMEPILISVDTKLFNVIVCMFWSIRSPVPEHITPIVAATAEAWTLIHKKKALKTPDTSIGAVFVWLLTGGKLRVKLSENYESAELMNWISIFESKTIIVDEYPVFVYQREYNQRCFLSGEPCRTGVQLINSDTKKPAATLWFNAVDEETNLWVLNLVRFLFLPTVINEYCTNHIHHQNHELSDPELFEVYNWITELTKGLSLILYQEGVIPSDTAVLDRSFGQTR